MYSKADRPVNASFHIQVRSDTNDHMKDRKLDEIQLILCLNSFLTLEPFESAYVLVAVVSSLHRLPVWLRAIRSKQHPIWRLCQLKRQMDEREREGTLRSPSNNFTVEGTHLDCLRMSLLHRQKPIFYNCNKLFDFPLIRWQLFWWWSSRCAKNVSVPASNMWRLCDFLFHYESKLNVLTNFSTFPWDKETIKRHFSPCCAISQFN